MVAAAAGAWMILGLRSAPYRLSFQFFSGAVLLGATLVGVTAAGLSAEATMFGLLCGLASVGWVLARRQQATLLGRAGAMLLAAVLVGVILVLLDLYVDGWPLLLAVLALGGMKNIASVMLAHSLGCQPIVWSLGMVVFVPLTVAFIAYVVGVA